MRVPSNEMVSVQIGLSNDTMILNNMAEASKGSPIKGGFRLVGGFVLVLAALVCLMMLYGILFPRPVAFDRVERSFVLDMVNRHLPERIHISRMEACYRDDTYYYTVDFRVGDDPNVERWVCYGFSGVEGIIPGIVDQELCSEYDRARLEGEQKVYTQTEIDGMLASIYDFHEKKGRLE